jgi:hypothetical protein
VVPFLFLTSVPSTLPGTIVLRWSDVPEMSCGPGQRRTAG